MSPPEVITNRRTAVAVLALVGAAVLGLPAGAGAVHWPLFGGEGGRSGYQPVDEGELPVAFGYSKTGAGDQQVRTSIVTTTGPANDQRLAFGTANGAAHLQVLRTGAPVGPENGTALDDAGVDDADTFGTGAGSVTFADTSTAGRLGQLFVVHNDDDAGGAEDIQVAQIDEASGALVAQRRVAGTDGFTVNSSPVVGPPDSTGARALFFVAVSAGDERLFRVPLPGGADAPEPLPATSTADIDATAEASPALVFLPMDGTPRPFLAVGAAGQLRLFAADTLTERPGLALGGMVQTPSVPVQPGGTTPGPDGPVTTAPLIYVASATAGGTTVYKIRQSSGALTPEQASDELPGAPAPALAVSQVSVADLDDAKVVVTTGSNLYLLSTVDLDRAGSFSRTALAAGTTGFAQTTAAASGDLVYVMNDQSQQLVLRMRDGKPVPGDEFASAAGAAGAASGFGQPAISRGFVQYGGGGGVFVYRNRDVTPPGVALNAPADGATLSGTVILRAQAFDLRGVAAVTFGLNGAFGGVSLSPGSGSPDGPPGAIYSAQLDTTRLRNGQYVLVAQATDANGLQTLSSTRRVTVRNLAVGACTNESRGTDAAETIDGTEAGDTLLGLGGDDILRGLRQADCLFGGLGSDTLRGGDGADATLSGHEGVDDITGGPGADGLFGGAGRDRLSGGAQPDVLSGGEGSDRLSGGKGADRLFGGAGADVLSGGPDRNRYSGGGGPDRIEAANGVREVIDCGPGRDRVRADRTDRLHKCERVSIRRSRR